MTREEKQKAINALKKSAPIRAMTQQEFSDYIQTINQVMDWLEQEPCEDAVSRAEVKKIAKEMYLEVANMELDAKTISDCISCTASKCREVLERKLQALSPVTPQEPKWIPVTERLPEEDGGYLVTVKRGYVTTALWVGNAKNWKEVTAWMPLPEPYKGRD